MRRSQRLIAAAVLIALSSALAGCSGGLSNFDPSDLLDWLDTKKKLPGDRKPVFPDGVPGVEQGVPKQMYKGSAQQQLDQQNAAAAAAPPPAAPAKSKQSKSKGKPAPAADQSTQSADPTTEEGAPADVPQDPKPKKMARKRTTAPPPDQPAAQTAPAAQPTQSAQQPAQSSAAPFPAPVPAGTFTR
jgi:hypothetical protein